MKSNVLSLAMPNLSVNTRALSSVMSQKTRIIRTINAKKRVAYLKKDANLNMDAGKSVSKNVILATKNGSEFYRAAMKS